MQEDNSNCGDTSSPISLDKVTEMAKNYSTIVTKNPSYALQQIKLTKEELKCLSKKAGAIKFIAVAYDPTDVNSLSVVVELVEEKDNITFYDLNKLFPSETKPKGSHLQNNHSCPPPDNCGIPMEQMMVPK